MSWLVASFVLLGLALGAGFWWYERSRPPAKLVALVASLAALAALGRIAFAPLPNVKPTTDIVLISGYVLGGAPGFMVGAVTAIASNVFFGQGPYTPWQMLAWGGVGVFGALLGRASGRRLGRVPLAIACASAGLAYGVFMDGSDWLIYGGGERGQLWVTLGRGVPFNIAHAVGNVVFFLAFGPALIRAVARFRERFEVRWAPLGGRAESEPQVLVAVLIALVLVGAAGAAVPSPAHAAAGGSAADRAAAYLQGARGADGGWGAAPRAGSSQLYTAWASMGLAADGRAPGSAAFITGHLGEIHALGDTERTILGLVAAGGDPRHAGGRDLVAELRRKRSSAGDFGGQVNLTAFAVLALRAAGASSGDPAVRGAARWIARQQNADGGFTFFRKGGASGIDDTGGALMALAGAGRRATPVARRAVAFLKRQRNRDGGWPLSKGAASNAQSTAWALQALRAAGAGGTTAGLVYLRGLQASDGHIRYSKASDQTPVWVSGQALAALRLAPLPIAAVRVRAPRAATPTPSAATVRSTPAAKSKAPAARRVKHGAAAGKSARSTRKGPAKAQDLNATAHAAGTACAALFAFVGMPPTAPSI